MPHDEPIIVTGGSVHLHHDEGNFARDTTPHALPQKSENPHGPHGQPGTEKTIRNRKHKKDIAEITLVTLTGFNPGPTANTYIPANPTNCTIRIEYKTPEPQPPRSRGGSKKGGKKSGAKKGAKKRR